MSLRGAADIGFLVGVGGIFGALSLGASILLALYAWRRRRRLRRSGRPAAPADRILHPEAFFILLIGLAALAQATAIPAVWPRKSDVPASVPPFALGALVVSGPLIGWGWVKLVRAIGRSEGTLGLWGRLALLLPWADLAIHVVVYAARGVH